MDEMDGLGSFGPHYFCAVPKNNIHIGHLIQAQLEADKKIFKKTSLDSDLILRISKAMHFNFFQYYAVEVLKEMKNRIGEE